MKHPNLYTARKEARMNITKTAEVLNIHRITYSKKECGDQDFTLSEAVKLSQVLGKSMDYLFTERST